MGNHLYNEQQKKWKLTYDSKELFENSNPESCINFQAMVASPQEGKYQNKTEIGYISPECDQLTQGKPPAEEWKIPEYQIDCFVCVHVDSVGYLYFHPFDSNEEASEKPVHEKLKELQSEILSCRKLITEQLTNRLVIADVLDRFKVFTEKVDSFATEFDERNSSGS